MAGKTDRTQTRIEKQKQELLAALEETGCNVKAACKSINLARNNFYLYLEDKAFADAVEEIREGCKDTAEYVLWTSMSQAERDSDRIKAAEIYLKARAKERGYGTTDTNTKISGELETTSTIMVRLPDNGRRTYEQPKDN